MIVQGQNEVVIRVRNLTKSFRVYDHPRELLMDVLLRRDRGRVYLALDNVSFDVRRGEVIGLIGPNGAGKSTLLKIIAGTLNASAGTVEVTGSISAILELGTGFQPDYSGRENVVIGAMCLGLSRQEALEKLDSIIEFSELASVIDQPFRTYSSGMKARLTFSTAISVSPEIFIVDEALAAGDAYFVNKCLGKMKEICSSGATVLFVSHSTDLVKRLCTRAILVEEGGIQMDGNVLDVCTEYELKVLQDSSATLQSASANSNARNMSSGPLRITGVTMADSSGSPRNAFYQHETVQISVDLLSDQDVNNPAFWLKIMRSDGVVVTTWLSHEPRVMDVGLLSAGAHTVTLSVDDLLLGDGEFLLTIGVFPEKHAAETAFYLDPLALWEHCQRFVVRRRGRPLSTIYDQNVSIFSVMPSSRP